MKKYYYLNLLFIAMAPLLFVGCSDSDDEEVVVIDNYYQEGSDVGYKSVVFDLPDASRLEDVKEHIYINLEMSGIENQVNYILPVKLSVDNGKMTVEAITGIINIMPHQDYYLNGVIFPNEPIISRSDTDTDDSANDVRLGVKVLMADPNNIALSDELIFDGDTIVDQDGNTIVNITCEEDLLELSRQYDLLTGDESVCIYRQTSYLTLSTFTWSPIGSRNLYTESGRKPFGQTYDGNGYYINHMHIYNLEPAALFSTLGDGAVVKNLKIENSDISALSGSAALASYVESGANVTIENLVLDSGTIAGVGNIGGVIGENYGDISFVDCVAEINLYYEDYNSTAEDNTSAYLGGFVGYNEGSLSFSGCSYYGNIEDSNIMSAYAGGFVGYSLNGTLTFDKCTTAGFYKGFLYCGGLVAYANGSTITATDIEVGQFYEIDLNHDSDEIYKELIDSRMAIYVDDRDCYAAGAIGYANGGSITNMGLTIHNSTSSSDDDYNRCMIYKDSDNSSAHIGNYVGNISDTNYSNSTGAFSIISE